MKTKAHLTRSYLLLVLQLLIFIYEIDGKGGKGGGSRSSASRSINFRTSRSSGGYKPSSKVLAKYNYPSYNTYRGARWASFGSGIVAFGIMSTLARQNYYGSRENRYYHSTVNKTNNSLWADNECINNEDFNGTVFGIFVCPLAGFNDSAKYCCGSFENQTQFCCDYYDRYNEIHPSEFDEDVTLSIIVCIIIIIVAIVWASHEVYSRTCQNVNTNNTSDQTNEPFINNPSHNQPLSNSKIKGPVKAPNLQAPNQSKV